MHESARQFLVDLGRKITDRSGDDREGSFCFSFVARQLRFMEQISGLSLLQSLCSEYLARQLSTRFGPLTTNGIVL